jgi:TetR/AcrR family transcriptional regulator, transcriptional repressor for nem operon
VRREAVTTRFRLLEAARFLFWEKGFATTGMAELLERAQANSGSFYHFFDSKEALLLALLDSYIEGLQPAIIEPATTRFSDPIDRIFSILQGYRDRLLATGCRYACPIGRLALEIETENLPAHSRIAANFSAWTGAIRNFLADARDRLPADADLDGLAVFVLTVMEGGVMQSRSYRQIEPFDQSTAHLRSYFEYLQKEKTLETSNRSAEIAKGMAAGRPASLDGPAAGRARKSHTARKTRKSPEI